ncbi:MAG: DnaD domain protein [Lachnospiraceae bacterium]|nr:DnaD domain protein [Lachnospiraceae bacterium]
MSCFKVSESGDTGVTFLYNEFLDEYMPRANEIQLKVFLYLTRVLRAGKPTSVADIAEKFNFTDREVKRALTYWEKEGLLEVMKDRGRSVEGVRMLAPWSVNGADYMDVEEDEEKEEPRHRRKVQSAPSDPQNDEDTAQILFLAERYLARPLTRTDTRSIIYISRELNFSPELADYLIQYCVQGGHSDLRYIERTAVAWAEKGVRTPAQAKRQAAPVDSFVYDVMNALGKSSKPTQAESAYVDKWKNTFGFSADMILEACKKTVLATDSHRFNYADGILTRWHEAGIFSIESIETSDREKKSVRSRGALRQGQTSARGGVKSSMRGDYDTDEIEKTLLSNGTYAGVS